LVCTQEAKPRCRALMFALTGIHAPVQRGGRGIRRRGIKHQGRGVDLGPQTKPTHRRRHTLRQKLDGWCAPRLNPSAEPISAPSQAYRHSDSRVVEESDGGASSIRAGESTWVPHRRLSTPRRMLDSWCAPRLSLAAEPLCSPSQAYMHRCRGVVEESDGGASSTRAGESTWLYCRSRLTGADTRSDKSITVGVHPG
jgi:hypothetical protein